MSAQQQGAVSAYFKEVLPKHQWERIPEIFASNVVLHVGGSVPPLEGMDALVAASKGQAEAWKTETYTCEINFLPALEGHDDTHTRFHIVRKAEKKDGTQFEQDTTCTWRFVDGKCAEATPEKK
eukprot:TRINITY_DN67315_c1_g1_i1.p3 TRINITY_DN67315_c1_g1~~TRINITY_DN67315_c1_g1_i1.p3  ORF type:complete len:124 (-),score=26.20 TRINITY_DN67315_c1_g1_i1:290-661(-)